MHITQVTYLDTMIIDVCYVFKLATLGLACVLNFIEILFLCCNKRSRKPQRILILSQATSDLTSAIVMAFFYVPSLTYSTTFKVSGMLLHVSQCMSLVSAWLITLDRIVAIFLPLKHRIYLTSGKVWKTISVSWVLFLIYGISLESTVGASVVPVVITYVFLPLLILSAVFFIVSYICMYLKFRRNNNVLQHKCHTGESTGNLRLKEVRRKQERRLFGFSFGVTISFLVCNIPFIMFWLVSGRINGCKSRSLFQIISLSFFTGNLIVDPVLYFWTAGKIQKLWNWFSKRGKNSLSDLSNTPSASFREGNTGNFVCKDQTQGSSKKESETVI